MCVHVSKYIHTNICRTIEDTLPLYQRTSVRKFPTRGRGHHGISFLIASEYMVSEATLYSERVVIRTYRKVAEYLYIHTCNKNFHRAFTYIFYNGTHNKLEAAGVRNVWSSTL